MDLLLKNPGRPK